MNEKTHSPAAIAERTAARIQRIRSIKTPQVGDYVCWTGDTLRRISHVQESLNMVQTSLLSGASYYVSKNGAASMSGAMRGIFPAEFLKDYGEVRLARFWFFVSDWAQAHNGADCDLPVRVWHLEPYTMTEPEAESHPYCRRMRAALPDNAYMECLQRFMANKELTF